MVFNLSYNNKKTSSSNEEDAIRTGLEPATSAVTGRHSNQLNYRISSFRFAKIQLFLLYTNFPIKKCFHFSESTYFLIVINVLKVSQRLLLLGLDQLIYLQLLHF